MGANFQKTFCDCFEKTPKRLKSKSSFPEVTLSPRNQTTFSEKSYKFLQEDAVTTNFTQNLMGVQDAVLLHSSSKNPNKNISLQNFSVVRVLGRGSSGKVFLVQRCDDPISNDRLYAMKMINKSEILKYDLADHIKLERNILLKNKNRFLVKLKYAFQTPVNIYLVMEYMSGGNLHQLLKKYRNFPEGLAQFYAAEIILALEYLHEKMHVIYRDLKPDNILLDGKGHIKLSDFGLSKKKTLEKTNTFAGTPEYIAPEILLSIGHDYSVDFWSLGIVLFEMLSGKSPFTSYDGNFTTIVKLILENKPFFPVYFSVEATDIISKLLKSHPKERLGTYGFSDIKKHVFFKTINWDLVSSGNLHPPMNIEEGYISLHDQMIKIQEINTSQQMINLSRISYNPDVTIDGDFIDKSMDRSLIDRSLIKSIIRKGAGK